MNGRQEDAEQHPFGDYIARRFARRRRAIVRRLFAVYRRMSRANALGSFVHAACEASRYIDRNLPVWKQMLGGGVTPFSNFRGLFLEEVTLCLARLAARSASNMNLVVTKLPTGGGVVTGIALAFRTRNVPDPVPVHLRRDREDVIVGFRRTLRIGEEPDNVSQYQGEIIPICMLGCKMYVDATRLENVLAKAKNMYSQYSSCSYLVVAEWDALGQDWHDHRGRILDSLFAPVGQIVFLRGARARRPPNKKLRKASLGNPYRAAEMTRLYGMIKEAIGDFS